MNELYWISVLDGIGTIGTTFLIISSVVGTIAGIATIACETDGETVPKSVIKCFRISLIVFIFSLISEVFIPSKKEMYAIWGIGSTIDYIRQNDTAKKLPDKCIKALDRWVDSIAADYTKTNNKN